MEKSKKSGIKTDIAGDVGYSTIGKYTPASAEDICVYCNHCQPCPAGINVGRVNKYYNLVQAGDELTKGHDKKLPSTPAAV